MHSLGYIELHRCGRPQNLARLFRPPFAQKKILAVTVVTTICALLLLTLVDSTARTLCEDVEPVSAAYLGNSFILSKAIWSLSPSSSI